VEESKSLLVLIEGTDELLPVARGIGARRIDGSIYHWRADAAGAMPQTFISCTGVGTRRSRECTQKRIAETSPGLIVSAGTFGALVDGITPGQWLVGARSLMLADRAGGRAPLRQLEDGEAAAAQAARLRQALAGKWLDGLLVCVGDVPLIDTAEKAAIASARGAVGVDMETFGIAEAASAAGVPWLTARVCVDTPALPLPDFGALNPVSGRPYYGRLLGWAARHPLRCVPTLYGLWKLVNVYGRELARLIREGHVRP